MNLDFKEKVALLTGAASRIGRETALLFVEEGAKVMINDLRRDEALRVVREVESKGGSAIAIEADVSNLAEAKRMVEEALKAFGQIDILINNAGVFPAKPIRERTEIEFDRVMGIHLKSVFNCVRVVVNSMVERGYGRIVSLSSVAGKVGSINQVSHYAAAKAGIIGFSKSIGRELGQFNITVNGVAPGLTDTPNLGASRENIQKAAKASPLGRLAQPREIANLIVF